MIKPLFTAVIRAKNKEGTIGISIASVLDQTVSAEVIVIDSGSTDRTLEVARSLGAKVIEIPSEQFTYGYAINVGVAAATTNFVLILSAHCALPSETWASSALAHFEDPRVAAVNGFSGVGNSVRPARVRTPEESLTVGDSKAIQVQDRAWFGFVGFSNHASLVRKDVALAQVFDERMSACEDKEWANRVVNSGYEIVYSPSLAVSGLHRRKEGVRALYRRAQNESLALSKLAGRPVWGWRQSLVHAATIGKARRGIKRFASIRPSNIVEYLGRTAGARRVFSTFDCADGRARLLEETVAPMLSGRVDLLNFPLHNNCGDSAIWLGQRRLLRDLGVPDGATRSFTNVLGQFPVRRPAPTALVRGGGYLGDVWPVEMAAFMDACSRYHGQSIIFMPQTIHFQSDRAAEPVRNAISRHGAVTLLLRDRQSFDLGTQLFPMAEVHLVPDSAQCLTKSDLLRMGGSKRALPAVRVVARRDAEADNSLSLLANDRGVAVFDFVDAQSSLMNRFTREMHEVVRARFPESLAGFLITRVLPGTGVLDRHARAEVRRAVHILSGAEKIITDRLHAAILASILEIEVVAVDTGYGKLRRYFDAWPTDHVRFVASAEQALAELR